MFRLSEKLAHLEDRISARWGKKLDCFLERRKGKWKLYIPLALFCWYFYGMLINSIRLGIESPFGGNPSVDLGGQSLFQLARRVYPNRPGGNRLLLLDVLPPHQERLYLVFRL